MFVSVLGPLEARDDGRELALGPPQARTVFAILAAEAGRAVSIHRLVDELWPDRPPRSAVSTIQTHIATLRAGLGAAGRERIVTAADGYLLQLTADEVDATVFAGLIAQADLHTDMEERRRGLEQALDLWRGPPFGELAARSSLLAAEATRLEELHLTAQEKSFDIELRSGRAEHALGRLRRLAADHPFRERLAALHLRALEMSGRRTEALDAFLDIRRRFVDEYGVEPGPMLQEVHQELLQEPDPTGRSPVSPSGDGSPAGCTVPFPGLLAAPDAHPYVGRAELLARLDDALAMIASPSSALGVLLAGEPGVGKTRTATELARRAFDRGVCVLYGRCDEGLLVPYQPFMEALDWQTGHDPGLPLGRLPGELRRLLPDLPQRVPDLPAAVTSDPRVEQYRLYEAVAGWLKAASQERGLLLILDDLHWAGAPTVELLGHVLRTLSGDGSARLLLVATYRDTDVEPTGPLPAVLGELYRLPRVDVLPIRNLSADEVVTMVESATGHALDEIGRQLAARTHEETEGNPFFIGEVIRHLVDTGIVRVQDGRWTVTDAGLGAVPSRLKDVIERRVSRLSPVTNTVLHTAAVIGRDVDVEVLGRLADLDEAALLDVVDEALRVGLMEETQPDQVRFTHAIVRSALYDQLSATRRRRTHARVLDVLEEVRPEKVGALARHALEAGPAAGPIDRTIRHCVAAAEAARAGRAHGDAERWFRKALMLAADDPPSDRRLTIAARCGLGETLHDLGDPSARETLLAAGHAALDAGEMDLAVRASVANTRVVASITIGVDRDRTALLETLVTKLDAPTADRARIAALLAGELSHDPDQTERRLALADEAFELAEQLAEPLPRAWIQVTATYPAAIPRRAHQLAARASSLVELADRSEDPALRCVARYVGCLTRMTVGDLATVRRWSDEGRQIASADAAPVFRWMLQGVSNQAVAYDGDLQEARTRNAVTFALGQELEEPDAASFWGGLEGGLAWLDGTYPHLADTMGGFADSFPEAPVWRTAHIQALVMAGRRQEGREVLERHALADPKSIPQDSLTLTILSHLAFVAFDGGWPDLAERLVPEIEPYRDLWAHFAVFCAQPMELALGTTLAAAGRWDEAVEAACRGRELLADRGMRSHRPLASLYTARVIAVRSGPGDAARARQVAAEGLEAARSMDMDVMSRQLEGFMDFATP